MFLVDTNSKPFEQPPTGDYVGVIADIIDLGKMKTKYGERASLRIIWLLNANDSEGNPFRLMQQVTQSMHTKAALYKIVKEILDQEPDVPYDVDALIGISRRLYVKNEKAPNGQNYPNIKTIMPLGNNTAMVIPATFVRSKDKPKNDFSSEEPVSAGVGAGAQVTF